MFSGIIRRLPHTVTAVALIAAATISPCTTAAADPGQDQKFFDLLGQKEIPPVDNANSLIATAKKACSKLDEGMPAGDLVELIRNNGFNENPLARLQPQDRITRTITQFINASVEAYCPHDRGKIASIAGYRARPGASRLVVLASFSEPLHAGEIAPTKPLPAPAQPPPIPEEIPPPPQQPPPPHARHVQPAPAQAPAQQAEPPSAEAPAPDPGPPTAAPAPGGGAAGGDAPATPTPDQPTPPGHIRLAP
jgi:outer membrane biosynthesis protein TonB